MLQSHYQEKESIQLELGEVLCSGNGQTARGLYQRRKIKIILMSKDSHKEFQGFV